MLDVGSLGLRVGCWVLGVGPSDVTTPQRARDRSTARGRTSARHTDSDSRDDTYDDVRHGGAGRGDDAR